MVDVPVNSLLQILNACMVPVQVSLSVSGSEFSLTSPSTVDLSGKSNANATVQFRPQALGTFNGILTVATASPAQSIDISLEGTCVLTGVKQVPGVPEGIVLYQNYPNPFNPSTEIVYALDRSVSVSLDVYTLYGKHVVLLVNEAQQPGVYRAAFDGSGLPAGLYAAVLRCSDSRAQFTRTMIMTLMK